MAIADGVSLLLVNRVCHPPALLDSRPRPAAVDAIVHVPYTARGDATFANHIRIGT